GLRNPVRAARRTGGWYPPRDPARSRTRLPLPCPCAHRPGTATRTWPPRLPRPAAPPAAAGPCRAGLQPEPAGPDLHAVRALVDPALAPLGPLEVLDRVGHVHVGTVDAGLVQSPVQDPARGPD